jgi:hypothetical protein
MYTAMMAPPIAALAAACMNRLSAAELCDPVQTEACGNSALAQACPDTATLGQLCDVASGPCKTSQGDCVALLSGLTEDGQVAVAHCVAAGCASGLSACVEKLATSN